MIQVVLDTNVVVSALLSPAGFEDRALRLALHGRVRLYVSSPIMNEYERILRSPKFGFSKAGVHRTSLRIQNCAHIVRSVRTLTKCTHEEDNRFMKCAEVAATSNQRHFPSDWKRTSIVNAPSSRNLWLVKGV